MTAHFPDEQDHAPNPRFDFTHCRDEFESHFGHPTDIDAVWRARELHQDAQESLTRIADSVRRTKRITS